MLRFAFGLHHIWLRLTRPLTLGVRLILVCDGQVLLVRHTYQDGWLLPGGGVEKGETLEQAARREAREETGAALGALALLGVYTNFAEYKSDHVTVFACRDVRLPPGGPVRQRMEIAAASFFALDDLPPDLLPGHRRRLEEFRAGQEPGFGSW